MDLTVRADGRIRRTGGRSSWVAHPAVPLVFVLLVSLIAHSFNLRNFPVFDQDEGTYLRDAWAVLRTGNLSSYVYIYGHSPLGWLQLAGWLVATGGFWTFGSPLDSGRIMILLLHLGSTFFLYKIALQLSGRKDVAIIACFIFGVSPMAVSYQRRVNLDNMMVFWLLVSFYLLLFNKDNLGRIILSALVFGLSVLVKETAIFFLPAYLYLVYVTTHPMQRRMGIPLWLSVSAGVVSTYILYAALKGELFPAGTLLGGSDEHVSLIETYMWQGSRTGHGSILNSDSLFWMIANNFWLNMDRFLVVGGGVATLIVIVATIRNRLFLAVGLIPLIFFLYVARGGVVFDFYIIPAIPFLALSVGLVAGFMLGGIERLLVFYPAQVRTAGRAVLVVTALIGLSFYYLSLPVTAEVFSANRTAEQRRALEWVATNLPGDTYMVIDGYAWTELHEGRPEWGGKKFPNAHFYWNVAMDPDAPEHTGIRTWQDIEYLLVSPIMVLDLERESLDPVLEAYERSDLVAKFDSVEIRKVRASEVERVRVAGLGGGGE